MRSLLLCTLVVTGPVTATEPRFPLTISENQRYLVDQAGEPFLVHGDTPWSLIVELTDAEIDLYLDDRAKKRFNSVIVNLIEHKFSSDPPNTKAGLAPFRKPDDFATSNPAYFDFASRVVEKAHERGIVVWLAPAYLGYGGGDEGFFAEMKRSGPESLRAYGRSVGERFRDVPNIVWMVGGDYTPAKGDQWTVTEVAEGIREADKVHLITGHAGPGDSAVAAFGNRDWLGVNTVYSYEETLFDPLLREFRRKPIRPFVMIESAYENEHGSRRERLRRQAYWPVLNGACGQFFGNRPIWYCGKHGDLDWQTSLDSAGSKDMVHVRAFLDRPGWQQLVPDQKHEILTAGVGDGTGTASLAASPDRTLALAYLPSTGKKAREVTIDLDRFPGPVTASWFNPTDGTTTKSNDTPLPNQGERILRTPGDNGTGTNDWGLILSAEK